MTSFLLLSFFSAFARMSSRGRKWKSCSYSFHWIHFHYKVVLEWCNSEMRSFYVSWKGLFDYSTSDLKFEFTFSSHVKVMM